jgi:hypothetical protein
VLYSKSEQRPEALVAANQAVHLDPLNSSYILRLSLAYEMERQYVKAYEWLKKGLAMIPAAERQPHKARLVRLADQAEDMKQNVFRGDPFDILPLEVIIAIMKFNLEDDLNSVIRASLVNRMWHNTLVNNCPELWGNLPLLWKELKDKSFNDKREAFIKRSRGNFHTISIVEMTSTGIGRIAWQYGKYFENVKQLRVNTKDNRALFRLVERFGNRAAKVEHLLVDGGNMDHVGNRLVDRPDTIYCGLVAAESDKTLKTMEIRNVDFRDTDPYVVLGSAFFGRRWAPEPKKHPAYPALKRLTVKDCIFDITDATPARNIGIQPRERFLSCPLHQTLRGAKDSLEHLEVTVEFEQSRTGMAQTSTTERIEMTGLKDLTIPPCNIRAIDIRAPSVERFSVAMDDWISKREYERRSADELLPLIPTIEESPISYDVLSRLTTLECSTADTIPRLEPWLSGAHSLTRLVIRGTFGTFVPEAQRLAPQRENQVQTCLLSALSEHLDWAPKLTELSLVTCILPEADFRKLVTARKESETAATLDLLEWDDRNFSRDLGAWLHSEVPKFRHPGKHGDNPDPTCRCSPEPERAPEAIAIDAESVASDEPTLSSQKQDQMIKLGSP